MRAQTMAMPADVPQVHPLSPATSLHYPGQVPLLDSLSRRATAQGIRLGASQAQALRAVAGLADGPHDGVYLHGPAGRGKTWLLDGVVACAEVAVQRFHWTAFFPRLDAEVGRRMHQGDRLTRSLDAVLGDCALLCFDELEVRDPDDAGLVEHLLLRLAERGTRLLVTSNAAPADLLPDPLWTHWGAGLRRRLTERFAVCALDDGIDYRTLGPTATSGFATGDISLTPAPPSRPIQLFSGGRRLPVMQASDGTLWADFGALLSTPTGQQDYIVLCRHSGRLGLASVPHLEAADADSRQRFVTLVDVAYDSDTVLHLRLTAPADWSALPERTRSRLRLLRQT